MGRDRTGGQAAMSEREQTAKGVGGWLTRLARDVRGNTMMIVAASLIPLAGMVGGGVDISRMYIVKTRLQHACDAGALAGRKQMGGGTWAYNSYEARTEAKKFFDANFAPGAYGTTIEQEDLRRSFSETAGKVTGTARAPVPMTIMRIFGKDTELLSVTCDAEMRLPNTDVMFVLDTTGSMASKAVSTDTQTKIEALRSAVKCFYEIVARLDTTENCAAGAPSGGTGSAVQVRFGFVPYATNVNVGKSLKPEWMADNWTYQTRQPNWTPTTTTVWADGAANVTDTQYQRTDSPAFQNISNTTTATEQACRDSAPAVELRSTSGNESGRINQQTTGTNPRTVTWYTTQSANWYSYNFRDWRDTDGRCRRSRDDVTGNIVRYYSMPQTGTSTTTYTFNNWNYGPISKNVSALKNGTGWNSSLTMNVGNQGADVTLNWDGCIEERKTVPRSSYSPIPADAKDLNIDLVPTSSDPDSLWGPALPGAVFLRSLTYGYYWNGWRWVPYAPGTQTLPSITNTTANYITVNGTDYARPTEGPFYDGYFCPQEARKLQSWPTASTFETYVNGLTPDGNTYHDIGLLWGARFISPTGIFRAENEFTPQGAEIERHLIFMTDGEACTGATNYTAYGVPWWDRRQTDPATAPTDGCLTTGTLTEQVNARTAALCNAVKNKNITLWVIWFGASNTTIEDMLEACATSGRFFTARNSTDLQNTFKSIADQISALRLTR